MLDLRRAYLQVFVNRKLWKFQVVKVNNSYYYLTRLVFGLASAPRMMSSIVQYVLSTNEVIANGTDSYIDDIIVNEDIVKVDAVIQHPKQFGLEVK